MRTISGVDAATFVRRFSTKTILGVLLLTGASLTAGCSDAAQPVTHQDCAALTAVRSSGPAVRVSVKSNGGSSPDVSIVGSGFPAGSPIFIGYFGLPSTGDSTSEVDLPARIDVNADGSFAVTQYGVYDLKSCDDASMNATIAIAVGAGGSIASTSAPARFWCSNASNVASYDSACE
jgi:hypothetical protein